MPEKAPTASEAYQIILQDITDYLAGVRRKQGYEEAMRQAADEYVSPERAHHQLVSMLFGVPWSWQDFQGKKILDIGANAGTMISYLTSELGADAYGIEPVWSSCIAARKYWLPLQEKSRLVRSVGEKLPFADESFDLITSFNVMEHVKDPQAVMQEGWRLLKPGGFWFSTFPNYGSIWEGHYAIPWVPFANIPVGRAYVKLWGRAPDFVNDLQLLTIPQLRRIIKTLPEAEVLSWGDHLFLNRISEMEFNELSGMEGLGRVVSLLRKSGLARIAAYTANSLSLFTPISLTIRKKR